MAEASKEYPKYVDHPSETVGQTRDGKPIPKRVVVDNPMEESQLLGTKKKDKSDDKSENKDWGK